jgi:hypothetical protein
MGCYLYLERCVQANGDYSANLLAHGRGMGSLAVVL